MTDTIYNAVRHFTYFHPFASLWILTGVLVAEIAVIVWNTRRKLRGGE